jgi:hypothetical protein
MTASLIRPSPFTLCAWTDFTQKLPRIQSQVVTVVPGEFDGILAHAFCGEWLGMRLEDQ